MSDSSTDNENHREIESLKIQVLGLKIDEDIIFFILIIICVFFRFCSIRKNVVN